MIEDEDTRAYMPVHVLRALAALRAGGIAQVLTVLPMRKAGKIAFMLGIQTPSRTSEDAVNFEWFAPITAEAQLDGWELASVADLEAAGFRPHSSSLQ